MSLSEKKKIRYQTMFDALTEHGIRKKMAQGKATDADILEHIIFKTKFARQEVIEFMKGSGLMFKDGSIKEDVH